MKFLAAVVALALLASCVHHPAPPPGPPQGMPEVGQVVQLQLRGANSYGDWKTVTGYEGQFIVVDGGRHFRMSEISRWNEQR